MYGNNTKNQISQNNNVWIKKGDRLPEHNQRVLTHSPCYSGRDPTMEYRMMSGDFVKIATDVESWMIPVCNHGRYACHADCVGDPVPDCVWDGGDINDCVHAEQGIKKLDCKEWKEI